MTEEQYKRAVEISNRLKDLNKVKDEIQITQEHKLSYLSKGTLGSSDRPVADWIMRPIADILDKHDKMIRADIDEEIEKLKKEVEEL